MKHVFSIFKKEILWYFNSPVGYILAAVFVVFNNFLFTRDFFLRGNATMRSFFEPLPWVLVFLCAGLSMRTFAEEKRSGTLETLVTLPLTEGQIVLGKFFAVWGFGAICLGLTLTLAITVGYLGGLGKLGAGIDWGPVMGGYFGAVLLAGAMSGVGMFISSLTKNQVGALLVAVFVLFWLVVLGEDLLVGQLPRFMAPFLQLVSFGGHLERFNRGLVDFRDAAYFISVITGTVFLTRERIMRR